MRIGWMRIDLHVPGSHSLKEKRRPVKSLIEKLRRRFNVSVAEVDCHDLHQRAVLGVAIAASDGGSLADQMRSVREFIHDNPECAVLHIDEKSLAWREDG